MPLRLKLPVIFGSLAYLLIGWDFYNESVIERMGMAWDTSAPVWPYRAAHILLVALNGPAWGVAVSFERSTGFVSLGFMAWVLFLMILLQWWFVGLELECRHGGSRDGWLRALGFAMFGLSAMAQAVSRFDGAWRLLAEWQWHWKAGLYFLEFVAPVLWPLGMLLFAARIMWKGRLASANRQGNVARRGGTRV